MDPILRLQLLGGFGVVYSGKPLVALNAPRLQSLVAYLVLHRDAPQSRRGLAFLLWPDSSEAQARTDLRNLLHQLRRRLPEAERFVAADDHMVQWLPDAPFSLDVARFEEQAAAGALEEAVQEYRGPLLPDCYDDWIAPERERLQQDLALVLERLAQRLERDGDYAAAITQVRRLVGLDPLREGPYRQLMRLHALNGDRGAALHVYHTCATTLQRELGVAPGVATRQAYERLLHVDSPPEGTGLAAVLPLVGRQGERARLLAAWRSAIGGRPQMLLLAGEVGIGKTRLVEELVAWAGRQGIRTARARCYAAEGGLAYGPAVAPLRDGPLPPLEPVWLVEVARLLPELLIQQPGLPPPGPLDEAWQRQRLFEGLARAILNGDQPLLLALEDLHWCDRDTLEWLHYLLRFRARARMLIVSTYRPEEMPRGHPLEALLRALRSSGQVGEIELGPLDPTDTARLAAAVAGHEIEPDVAAQLYEGTEGNPLFVVEMVRARQFGPGRSASLGEGNPAALPPRVRTTIAGRFAQLSPQAHELLGVAATIGRAFGLSVLQLASGEDEETLVRALDELWQRRIVREQGQETYDFSHDKLREVAYAELSAARRRLLHRWVAEALTARVSRDPGRVSGEIALHYERAGEVQRAIDYYAQATAAARRVYANGEALRLTERALRLLAAMPDRGAAAPLAARLHESLGDTLDLIGRHEEAQEAFGRILRQPLDAATAGPARAWRKIGASRLIQHRYDEAWAAFERADAALEVEGTSRDRAWWEEWVQVRIARLVWHYRLGQWRPSADLLARSRAAVEEHGTPLQRSRFLSVGAMCAAVYRDRCIVTAETVTAVRDALAAAQEAADMEETSQQRLTLGFVLLWHGDLEQAAAEMEGALAMAEHAGDVVVQARCLVYLTMLERRRGRVEQCAAYGERCLALAAASGHGEFIGSALAARAWVAWRAGDWARAEKSAHAALDRWRGVPYVFQSTALWPLIGIALARGALAEAIEYVRALLPAPQQRLPNAIVRTVEGAIRAWEQRRVEAARTQLVQAAEAAQELGFL